MLLLIIEFNIIQIFKLEVKLQRMDIKGRRTKENRAFMQKRSLY